jgi:hypothetical protein
MPDMVEDYGRDLMNKESSSSSRPTVEKKNTTEKANWMIIYIVKPLAELILLSFFDLAFPDIYYSVVL